MFSLFFPNDTVEILRGLVNSKMSIENPVSASEMISFLGLMIAMSIAPLQRMRNYWSCTLFLGLREFLKIISRNRFLAIHSAV